MMKKLMVIFLSFVVIAAMISVFSCSKDNPEEPSPTNTPILTSTCTPTSTPTLKVGTPWVDSTYNFDTGLQNWQDGTQETGFDAVDVNANKPRGGNGQSVEIKCSFEGTGNDSKDSLVLYTNNNQVDLRGKNISVWVYIPSDLKNTTPTYGVQIFIFTGDNWSWKSIWFNISDATPDDWNEFKWAPSGVGEEYVQAIGIQISKGNGAPDWTGTIYIDDIYIGN